jgi:hypothetical protein
VNAIERVARGLDRRWIADFAPPLIVGVIAWSAFTLLGGTPFARALAMSGTVIGMALALRPLGAVLSMIGALALAFSPSFWMQTDGGGEAAAIWLIGAALIGIGTIALSLLRRVPAWGIVFAALVPLLIVIGAGGLVGAESLRITTFLTAWLLYLLTEMLILTDIRSDAALLTGRQPYRRDHAPLILLVMIVGVINDPLFALWSPAVLLGVWLARRRLHPVYWIALIGAAGYGVVGIAQAYLTSTWWGMNADSVAALGRDIPYLVGDGWREPARWIALFDLVIRQFTAAGLVLGVIGLTRLSRWHPPIGVITMLAYGAYAAFGLMYFGGDAETLLLPLLMIQVMWMTYAVYTFGQWAQKVVPRRHPLVLWFAPAAFTLLPFILLLRIMGVL